MDGLGWVESNYGSVAEYNRCMYEDDRDRQEDYAEQNWRIIEQDITRDMRIELDKKLEKPVSEAAKVAKESGVAFNEKTEAVAEQYGVKFHERKPDPEPNKFIVSYEYVKGGMYHHVHSDAVDMDTFMNVYNDMYHINSSGMSYHYYDENAMSHGSTGVPLSYIRSSDFPRLDIDDPEGRSIIHDVKSKYRSIRDERKAAFDKEEAEKARSRSDLAADDMYGYMTDEGYGY